MPTILHRRGRPPHPDILTPAEWQVLDGVRAGRTNQEIADQLGITFHTVKYHISNMLGKLQVEDRQTLASWRPGRVEREPRGHWRAFLPLGGLKVAGITLASSAAVIGIAGTSILAIRTLGISPEPPAMQEEALASFIHPVPPAVAPPASRADVLASLPQSSPGVTAEFTGLSSARTSIRMTITLPDPVPTDAVPSVGNAMLIRAHTTRGIWLVSDRGRDYQRSANGYDWVIDVDASFLPPNTVAVEVEVRGMTEISVAQGVVEGVQGPWVGVLPVPDAPIGRDLSSRVPATLDTGYGWRYVIDGVDLIGSVLALTYHAEGDIQFMSRVHMHDGDRAVAEFVAVQPTTKRFEIPAGAESFVVTFGAATRLESYLDDSAGSPESGDWSITIPLK